MNKWIDFIIIVAIGAFGAWAVCSMFASTPFPWEWTSGVKALGTFIALVSVFTYVNSGDEGKK